MRMQDKIDLDYITEQEISKEKWYVRVLSGVFKDLVGRIVEAFLKKNGWI